jgi:hypothetical protein
MLRIDRLGLQRSVIRVPIACRDTAERRAVDLNRGEYFSPPPRSRR